MGCACPVVSESATGRARSAGRAHFGKTMPLTEKPRILILDNYDSFTYNLFQLVSSLRADAAVRRNDKISLEEMRLLSPDGIIISPGPGHPASGKDFGICLSAIQQLTGTIPILGVCLGHQGIIHAFGGSVVRARNLMHGKTSELVSLQGPLFGGVSEPLTAMRYHSLVGEKSSLPSCLRVTALSRDDGEIMAVEHLSDPTFGIQFHPESVLTGQGARVMENFLNTARRGAE